ncbi:hypothetical protein GCM10007420_05620 [Glycocaulis albus]|uniref:Uncharacterized protein n=1 Tax=Glycocaulis albus TaxID=1382801 RepID=A0ABQ1XFF8_9PROT|nr:hypothetical protein GCM10007420_05620 [Glycocaulis albus]
MHIETDALCADPGGKPLCLFKAAASDPDIISRFGQNFGHLTANMAISANNENTHVDHLNCKSWLVTYQSCFYSKHNGSQEQ